MMRKINKDNPIPIWERALITVEEGTALTGIGYLLRLFCPISGLPLIWNRKEKRRQRNKRQSFMYVRQSITIIFS